MIGEDAGSMPEERRICNEREPKRLRMESAEQAKRRLVQEITSAVTRAVSVVFRDKGYYLLQSVRETNFGASGYQVSKTVRKQALREALETVMADVDGLIEPPKNSLAEPSSYQERASRLLR